jgi:prolyl-tRNA synthetase
VATIEALTRPPYSVAAERQLKTLVYVADGRPVVAVVRGDDELNEAKLQIATGATQLRPAEVEEIVTLMGAHPGSLGAVGFTKAPVLVDEALAERPNMTTGANRDGFHLRGVDVRRDVLRGGGGGTDGAGDADGTDGTGSAAGANNARVVDLRAVKVGEACVRCGNALQIFKALEVGHIFKLGTRYAEKLGASVLLADGTSTPIVMGSYGIGIGRIMAAAVEQHHDEKGIVWPMAIAPFGATVLSLTREDEVVAAAGEAAAALAEAGLDVLHDDRDVRAGVKLNDADLIGIPIRVAVGKRSLAEGRRVEWKERGEMGEPELVPLEELGARAREAR